MGTGEADVGRGAGCIREGTFVSFRWKQTEEAGF